MPSPVDVASCGSREPMLTASAPCQAVPGGVDEHELALPAAAADPNFAVPVQYETAGEGRKIGKIPASALLAQLVEHFHGKEGVVGSSPTEGLVGLP